MTEGRLRRLAEAGDLEAAAHLKRLQIRTGSRTAGQMVIDALDVIAEQSRASQKVVAAMVLCDAREEWEWVGARSSPLLHLDGVCTGFRWPIVLRTEAIRRLAAGRLCKNCERRIRRWNSDEMKIS